MNNHVHFLAVPHEEDSLRWTFQLTHKAYAEYINAQNTWTGHLWQQRFYSSAVDEEFLWITLRYIERNPVAAKIVEHPADYTWSSARARCYDIHDPILTNESRWEALFKKKSNWHNWLAQPDSKEKIAKLRKRTSRYLPTGSDEFLEHLEDVYRVKVKPLKLGRPKKRGSSDCH